MIKIKVNIILQDEKIKVNLILQDEKNPKIKSGGKSSSSISSYTVLNANDLLKNSKINGTGQLRPILKTKDSICGERYFKQILYIKIIKKNGKKRL